MKTPIIYYVVFSFVLLIMIYFFTLIQVTRSRNLDVYDELKEEAVETLNYDTFIAYQSIAYQRVYTADEALFHVTAYQVIAKDHTGYRNQFMWILTKKDGLSYATSLKDETDQTALKLTKNGTNEVLFDSSRLEIYQSKPISYGLEKDGFYYYVFFLETTNLIDIEHIGYDGAKLHETTINYNYEPFQPDGTFLLGMSEAEKDALVDIDTYLRSEMTTNITIFLVVDILCGGLLFFLFKLKKR